MRHEDRLRANQRMTMQMRNVDRLSSQKKAAIRIQVDELRKSLENTA